MELLFLGLAVTIPTELPLLLHNSTGLSTVTMLTAVRAFRPSCFGEDGCGARWWKREKEDLSHYRAGETMTVPEGWGSQISRQQMKVVRFSAPRTGRLHPQESSLVLTSVEGWVHPRDIVRSEVLSRWKIPMTPSGTEPATFRLLAQCPNQLRHCVPPWE